MPDRAPVLTHTLRRSDLIRYAGASGDFYPLHTDDAYAREAGLPGIFAHGMFSAGLLATAVTDWAGVGSLRRYHVRFAAKTWPGETLCTDVVATERRTERGEDLVDFDCRLRGADGEVKIDGSGTVGCGLPSTGTAVPGTGPRWGAQVVTIDRAPVSVFAAAVQDHAATYRDARVARDAGFADVPAPPTYPFAMIHWGTRPELTAEFGGEPVPPNPHGEVLDHLGHIGHVMAELMDDRGPGLVLHAEQEYLYHRTMVVGDILRGENAVIDEYTRSDKTFVVVETPWTDVRTGHPVLTARFTAVHIPTTPRAHPEGTP